MTDEEIEELEKLIVKLHGEKRTDIYSLRSKHDPQGYARSQRKQKIPEPIRWIVWRRDGFKCIYCLSETASLTLDHVVPEEQGGNFQPENLVTACGSCNNKKGILSLKEFAELEWLQKKRKQNLRTSTTKQTQQAKTLEDLLLVTS